MPLAPLPLALLVLPPLLPPPLPPPRCRSTAVATQLVLPFPEALSMRCPNLCWVLQVGLDLAPAADTFTRFMEIHYTVSLSIH